MQGDGSCGGLGDVDHRKPGVSLNLAGEHVRRISAQHDGRGSSCPEFSGAANEYLLVGIAVAVPCISLDIRKWHCVQQTLTTAERAYSFVD